MNKPPVRGTAKPKGQQRAVKVRTAKSRSLASTLWLERQLNDPYVLEAKKAGYRSRAAFKLEQLDAKARLLRPGLRVVDLGAAPGGWTQVAARAVGAEQGRGAVVALDILAMEAVPGATVLTADMLAEETPARLTAALGGKADLVLSDMASPATGHRATDHIRVIALAEAALAFAEAVLAENGAFVAKVFQGGSEKAFLDTLKARFRTVRHLKPDASRAESAEVYVVAQGFKS